MSLVSSPTDIPSQGPACRKVFSIEALRDSVLSNLSGVDLVQARGVSRSWKQGCDFVAAQSDCGISMNYPFSPELETYIETPHSLPMVTGLDINKEELPELMAREDFWKILPNIWTMRIRPNPKEELGSKLLALLTVERSGLQRKLVFTPHRTMTQIMSSADRGIFKSKGSTITASWNLMLKPPKDEEEVKLHESFYKEPHDVHTIRTTSDLHGSRYTIDHLDDTLRRLYESGSAWNVKILSREHNFQADPDATYTSLAEKRKNLFPFGSDSVHSLTYRAHRPHDTAGDRFCPTADDCFGSPEFAMACEGLSSLSIDTRGSFTRDPHIPKTLKEMTFRYRVKDLPDASAMEAMASCLDKVDPEGSLTLKIEADYDLEARGTNEASVASQKLEDHRLARKMLYERKLQDPSGGSGAGKVDELFSAR